MIMNIKGIVLKEYTVGESDKYITLFTGEKGKIQVAAPFAKKYNKGLASGTQLFVYGEFRVKKIRDTYKLLWVEPLMTFPKLQENLIAVAYASYFGEFVREVTLEGVPQEGLLELLVYSLYYLGKCPEKSKLIRSIFEWRALALLGFMPQLQTCVRCNEKVDFNAQTYFFSMVDGGIVCSDCQEVGERPIFYNTCYTLIYLLVTPLKQVFRCEVSEALLKTLEKIIQTYVNYHIDLVFSTLDFIKGVENM